jgi:hypothetical protein
MSNFINEKIVKTKKSHNCFGCGRVFNSGTEMLRNTSTDGDQIASVYLCGTCTEILKMFPAEACDDYEIMQNFVCEIKQKAETPEEVLVRLLKEYELTKQPNL